MDDLERPLNMERPIMSEEQTLDMLRRMNVHEPGSPPPASRPYDPSRHPQPSAFGGFSPLDSFFPATRADRDLGPDDDLELQRILALSAATSRHVQLQEDFIRSSTNQASTVQSTTLAEDIGIGPIGDDDDDLELQRCLALSAAGEFEGLQNQDFVRSTSPTASIRSAVPAPPPRPPPATAAADDEDAAFMEAAIMASLEQPQPADSDEDDPLLAQALKASLEADSDPATAAASAAAAAGPLFPHLRAQQEAEERAAARQRAEGAGFGPGDFDPALFGGAAGGLLPEAGFFFDDEADGAPPPQQQQRQPSERTLESRRLRQDQDEAYEESLAADRAKEESRLEALRRERCALHPPGWGFPPPATRHPPHPPLRRGPHRRWRRGP